MRNLPPAGDRVRPYRRRAAIAAVCRDWKTSGWQWEASQVRDVAHQSALVLAAALAVGLLDHYFFNIEFSHMSALLWGTIGLAVAIEEMGVEG